MRKVNRRTGRMSGNWKRYLKKHKKWPPSMEDVEKWGADEGVAISCNFEESVKYMEQKEREEKEEKKK